MNIDELWNKYGLVITKSSIGKIGIDKNNFTKAIAEIISQPLEAEVSQENGGLDYDFIVRVMLSMTEYPDLLPENIRVEKTKLSKRYRELYDQREPHILARIEWLKEYIESRFSG